jgi:hypothetical protein
MLQMAFIRALFQQASAEGSRSTALKPLGWLVGMLCAATLAFFSFSSPLPLGVGVTFVALTVLAVGGYLVAYFYLMIKDRDSLRSERYSIQKLAIEKGIVGDNISGVLSIDEIETPKLLSEASAEQEDEK